MAMLAYGGGRQKGEGEGDDLLITYPHALSPGGITFFLIPTLFRKKTASLLLGGSSIYSQHTLPYYYHTLTHSFKMSEENTRIN